MDPKYRLLTEEELKLLEKEFIEFLILNGIVAEDWEKIKKESQENAAKIITAFSDSIMEGALRKTYYLEKTDPKRIASIHFQSDQMVLAAMEAPLESDADFTDETFVEKATTDPPSYLQAYTLNESYQGSRESVLFEFTEKGWLVSDGNLYKALALAASK